MMETVNVYCVQGKVGGSGSVGNSSAWYAMVILCQGHVVSSVLAWTWAASTFEAGSVYEVSSWKFHSL